MGSGMLTIIVGLANPLIVYSAFLLLHYVQLFLEADSKVRQAAPQPEDLEKEALE